MRSIGQDQYVVDRCTNVKGYSRTSGTRPTYISTLCELEIWGLSGLDYIGAPSWPYIPQCDWGSWGGVQQVSLRNQSPLGIMTTGSHRTGSNASESDFAAFPYYCLLTIARVGYPHTT